MENNTDLKVIIMEGDATTVIHVDCEREQLIQDIQRIAQKHSCSQLAKPQSHYKEYVFFKKSFGYQNVSVRNIDYLEAQRNYCNIYLTDNTYFSLSMPMNEVCEYLDPLIFKRIHRSFVVNLEHVNTLFGNTVVLNSKKEFTIGREYRESIYEEFVLIGSRKRVREKTRDKVSSDD